MKVHNFNILESKIKQAIEEIKFLKNENASLRSNTNETSDIGVSEGKDIDTEKKSELLHKVDEMLQVLDEI